MTTTVFYQLLTGVTVGSIGIANIIMILRKNKKEVKTEIDNADDRLNSLLKTTVDTLDRQVKELQEQQKTNMNLISTLQGENNIMKAILQGRDDKTDRFRASGEIAFKRIEEVHAHIEKLYNLLEQHFADLNH